MAIQTGRNILVAYKEETTFGVQPAVVTGAKQFRLNSGSGLRVSRTTVSPNEIRKDGQTGMFRLGARSVSGSYPADLSQGTFDDLIAAVLRGSWSGGKVLPATTPFRRSFTFEEYEQDADVTTVYSGCRISSMKVTLTPDGMALIEFGVVGANGVVLSGAAAPFYTSPALSTAAPMTAIDAAVSVSGVSTLDFTSIEFTVDNRAATQPVIGSTIAPDVFDNNMVITGSISAIRRDATRQSAFLAETEASLVLALSVPSPGTANVTFTLPRIKFTDFSRSLGNDNAMIATLPFAAAVDEVGPDKAMIVVTTTA